MSRTLLQLIQQAYSEVGLTAPAQVVGAADDQSLQTLALAQRESKEFSTLANGNGGWQRLHKQYTFRTEVLTLTGNTTAGSAVITGISSTSGITANTWGASANGLDTSAIVASVDSATQVTLDTTFSETQTGVTIYFGQKAYSLPSDFDYFVYQTFWDGAYRWELLGPITAQEKQILKYGIIASGPRRKFYIRDNKMWLDPTPTTDYELIAYDYYSKSFCQSSGGTDQTLWTADTDVYLLDEECFIQGMKWCILRAKGMDYAQEKVDYDNVCARVLNRDGGSRSLPLASGTYGARFLSTDNIPETNYGQ